MTNLKPKEPPKGWIKLEPVEGFSDETFYIRESKIIGLGKPKAGYPKTGNEEVTAVYTIYEDGNPLIVYGNINTIMEKIEKAQQEKCYANA